MFSRIQKTKARPPRKLRGVFTRRSCCPPAMVSGRYPCASRLRTSAEASMRQGIRRVEGMGCRSMILKPGLRPRRLRRKLRPGHGRTIVRPLVAGHETGYPDDRTVPEARSVTAGRLPASMSLSKIVRRLRYSSSARGVQHAQRTVGGRSLCSSAPRSCVTEAMYPMVSKRPALNRALFENRSGIRSPAKQTRHPGWRSSASCSDVARCRRKRGIRGNRISAKSRSRNRRRAALARARPQA